MKKNVIITILLVLVIGLGCTLGYVLLSKDDNTKNNSNNVPNNNQDKYNDFVNPTQYTPKINKENKTYTVDVDVSKYKNIFDYIEKQDDVSMSISYCKNGDSTDMANYTLSELEVKQILSEMKQSTQETSSGLGGGCIPITSIKYKRNGVSHEMHLYDVYAINETDDGNIYKIYDNNIIGDVDKFSTYGFDNLSATLELKLKSLTSSSSIDLDTLYSINENNFVTLSVGLYNDAKNQYNYASISDYSKAKSILSKILDLNYESFTGSGFGYAPYQIKIEYTIDNNVETVEVGSNGILLLNAHDNPNVQAYQLVGSSKELETFIKNTYNANK